MNGKQIRVSQDIYNDVENIRKKLIEKSKLHRDLTIRETMDIIWNLKDHDGVSLEQAIDNIQKNNIKIAWGDHGRKTTKHRKGTLNINLVTQVNK